MGQEFAIVYDIVVAAVFIGLLFAGLAKGFAKSVLEIASVFIAFICAMTFSEPLANTIYDGLIDKPVREKIEETLSGADEEKMQLAPLSTVTIDYNNVKISGTPVTEVVPNYEGTGKAVFDLTDVDLSDIGISKSNISLFGIEIDDDLSSVNARTAGGSMSDIETYGLGKLVVSQYFATTAVQQDAVSVLGDVVDAIAAYLPSSVTGGSSESISVSAVRTVILTMLDLQTTAEDALVDGIIKPNCVVVIRTILFALIFALVSLIMGILIKVSGIVNKIPVIGKVNALAGGLLGLLEGTVIVFIICLAVRLIISLAGKDAVFFNESTIEQTYLFKHIYNFNFLNFLT